MPPKKKNVEVSIAPLSATITKELVADPLDDSELRAVLGRSAKIVPYHKLSQYSSLDQLLPKPKDAVVILYENRPMDGHWIGLTKNNGEISFFDPYGEVIDKQLRYSNFSNQQVGEGDTSLHNLLSTTNLPVYFNDYKYQRDGGGVNTCGRHVANFIRYNIGEGLDLDDYNEMMKKTQKETNMPYDELIAKMVPIHIPHPNDAQRQQSGDDIAQQRGIGAARPTNMALYEEAKRTVYARYKKPSAYRSGALQKEYKRLGGTYTDDKSGRPLKRWFKEEWKDVGGEDYPVYRPTKRISKDTPLTASEVSPTNLRKQTALKQQIRGDENLPPFAPRVVGGARMTPVEKVGNNYIKRDDLFKYAGQRGGKVRSAKYLVDKTDKKCLTTAGNRNSPQINIIASIGRKIGKPVVAFTSTGELGAEVKLAKEKGAVIKQVAPGYETVITRRAKDYAERNGCEYIPFGMDTPDVHHLTAQQVANIPRDVDRIVIPVGSASSIIGVIKGVLETKRNIKVLGVVVGANPIKKLNKYVPNWRSVASLVHPKLKYHEPAKETNFNGIELDPFYEAKTLPYLKLGDLLWVVGVREGSAEEPKGRSEGGAEGHEGTDAVKLPKPSFKNDLVVAKKSGVKGGGWGLFAKVDIPNGTRIADFYGDEMKWSDFTKKYGSYKERKDLHQYAYLSRRQGKIILSHEQPYLSKNVVNYINEIPPNFNVELRQKALFAIKDIPKGAELSLEYPEAYDRFWLRRR